MTWSSTVHTTVSSDTEPSIVVMFADAKYIFNTSENTGRAFLQSHRNWRKTKALFFTQSRVEKTSGLSGLIMTFADATLVKLGLYGPPGLKQILASTRFYTFRDSIDVQAKEISWTTPIETTPQPCFSDTNISVYPIPTLPFDLGPKSNETTPELLISSSRTRSLDSIISQHLEKRKRETSPEPPRKRLNPGSHSPGRMGLSEELLAEIRNKDVNPSTFSGDIADEYRAMILRTMFPNTNPQPVVEPKAQKKGKASVQSKAENTTSSSPTKSEKDYTSVDMDVDTQRRSRSSLPNGFAKQLPKFSSDLPSSSTPASMSYLVVGPPYRGKFDAAKAQELGVEGRNRGRLTKGETVTIQVKVGDEMVERVIKPEDVLGESEKPSAILILDTPSPDHVACLVSAFSKSGFYGKLWDSNGRPSLDQDVTLRAVYHLCGDGVLENEQFRSFINGFGPEVNHVVASRDHCPDPVTFTSAAFSQLRLSNVDDKMFPLPKFSLTPKKDILSLPNLPPLTKLMSSGLHMELRPYSPPTLDPELALIDRFHPAVTGSQPLELSPKMKRCIQAGRATVSKCIQAKEAENDTLDASAVVGKDVGIIPLGTGGSVPSKYRNVLSTFIRIPEWGNILLDTGEGTWGQLARKYGLQEDGSYNAWQALRDLKCIFISHIHGDHQIGLAHLLAKRKSLNPPPAHPLYIVSVRPVHLYLRELSDVQDLGLFDPSGNGVITIQSEALHYRATGAYPTTGMWVVGGDEPWLEFDTSVQNAKAMCDSLGLERFRTADMYHRCRCFGCNFKHKDGWSISFSGDTMPTDTLVHIGKDSTVLIHEATMADDEADIAQKKAHSTITQAIGVGKKMNASNILLTHFSARHPKLPPSLTVEMSHPSQDRKLHVAPALDHANMTIEDMWKMSCYIPTLILNFKETSVADADGDLTPLSRSPSPARVHQVQETRKMRAVAS